MNEHHALIITQTSKIGGTTVRIGTGAATALSGGTWVTGADPNYSFYNLPMTNTDHSYTIANPAGLAVMGYGLGMNESYYYLAGSALRDLSATFYVNGEDYLSVNGKRYCNVSVFHIKSVLEYVSSDPNSILWYIDGVQKTTVADQKEWDLTNLQPGTHTIEMRARDLNGLFQSYESTISLCPLRIPVNQRN